MTIDPRYCPSEDPRNPANDTGPECPDCGASLGDEVECEWCAEDRPCTCGVSADMAMWGHEDHCRVYAQPDPDCEPECWGVGSLEHETNQCRHHIAAVVSRPRPEFYEFDTCCAEYAKYGACSHSTGVR